MPRMPRVELAGAVHHVTARAPKGLVLFRCDADRRHYLDLLASEVAARDWSLRTYCLMDTHVHLLIQTPEADLGAGMKCIHETFATYLHRTYATHGHVFGDRFHNVLVLDDHHYFACLRYIARNPVVAGLCATAADWPWSAHNALTATIRPPTFLDLAPTHDLLGVTGYTNMVATDDSRLLDDLARTHPSDWMVRAVDEHRFPVALIAAHLGLHPATVYRRLSKQRENGDSPLSRADANEGTVP